MKTAVIYARYSSDSQTEQSIEGQLRVCEEFAQRNDLVIEMCLSAGAKRQHLYQDKHTPQSQKF